MAFLFLFFSHEVIIFLFLLLLNAKLLVSWNYHKPAVSLLSDNNEVIAQNIMCKTRITFTQKLHFPALNFICCLTIHLSNSAGHSSVYP